MDVDGAFPFYFESSLTVKSDMPAKAKIYNIKCEPVFDFGSGQRNLCYYNPHGNNILFNE